MLRDLESSAAIRWHHGIMNPGVQWSSDPDPYSHDCLFSWADRLGDVPDVRDARLGLSDNLAGFLQMRPDAVLMGSFLWSDVLETAYSQNSNVRRFAEWERGLLDRFRPSMLCVGQMVMPEAAERTRVVPLPWMRSGRETRPDAQKERGSKGAPSGYPDWLNRSFAQPCCRGNGLPSKSRGAGSPSA